MRTCTKCGIEKPLSEFCFRDKKKGTYRTECRECGKKYKKEHYEKNKEEISNKQKAYYEENKELFSSRAKIYGEKNKEKISERNKEKRRNMTREERDEENRKSRERYNEKGSKTRKYHSSYYQDHRDEILKERKENIDHYRELHKKWNENNRERLREYWKNATAERRKTTKGKLKDYLRSRLRLAMLSKQKTGSAVKDLGCSIEELIFYIEEKFYDNPRTGECMSWDNYGNRGYKEEGWHIDHIIPLNHFNLEDRDQFLQSCHYTNLQPLWALDNLRKNDNLDYYT